MNRFDLAKIVQWAGTFPTRKRIQKVVFLLQAKGFPSDAEFSLHHYGPYSRDLARLTNEMVREGLLQEQKEVHPYGERYSYTLTEASQRQIAQYEETPQGSQRSQEVTGFRSLAEQLCQVDLKELEVAATLAFFREQGHEWATTVDKSCRFKGLVAGSPSLQKAERLARQIVE
jgi:hypothetical protein